MKKVDDALLKVCKNNNIKIDLNNLNLNLKESGIDSLKFMDLIFKVEEELNILVDDEKLIKINTLEDLRNTLIETLQKKEG